MLAIIGAVAIIAAIGVLIVLNSDDDPSTSEPSSVATLSGTKFITTNYDHATKAASYLGIKYGTAERFAPPQAHNYGRSSVVNASAYDNMCVQKKSGDAVSQGSEDCLFLNIFLPPTSSLTGAAAENLPVAIFVHSGSYTSGSSNQACWGYSGYSDCYAGESLTEYWSSKGLATGIVVTFNYRYVTTFLFVLATIGSFHISRISTNVIPSVHHSSSILCPFFP